MGRELRETEALLVKARRASAEAAQARKHMAAAKLRALEAREAAAAVGARVRLRAARVTTVSRAP